MSRAVELAERLGAVKVRHTTFAGELGFALCTDELEAFYHAARAEALGEAADEVNNRYHLFMEIELLGVVTDLRAMADREGKE